MKQKIVQHLSLGNTRFISSFKVNDQKTPTSIISVVSGVHFSSLGSWHSLYNQGGVPLTVGVFHGQGPGLRSNAELEK